MTTWSVLIARATARLAVTGVPSPDVDAQLLAAHVADVDRARLVLAPDPTDRQAEEYGALVERRAGRAPLQHLTGRAPFRRGEVGVGPGVFIPRPETELVVEWALAALETVERPIVVDACAGSGAIARAIVEERPDARVFAVEQHAHAVIWLRRNMTESVYTIVEGDAAAPATLPELDGTVDAVVSNPPYVPDGAQVAAEVAADPRTAVFGGPDGLTVIRPLIHRCAAWLRPGGVVAIEHDDSHGEVVPRLLHAAGFTDIADHLDLAGRARFATARSTSGRERDAA